jgi:hypothetical protein
LYFKKELGSIAHGLESIICLQVEVLLAFNQASVLNPKWIFLHPATSALQCSTPAHQRCQAHQQKIATSSPDEKTRGKARTKGRLSRKRD